MRLSQRLRCYHDRHELLFDTRCRAYSSQSNRILRRGLLFVSTWKSSPDVSGHMIDELQ